jgi:hypothetical protein
MSARPAGPNLDHRTVAELRVHAGTAPDAVVAAWVGVHRHTVRRYRLYWRVRDVRSRPADWVALRDAILLLLLLGPARLQQIAAALYPRDGVRQVHVKTYVCHLCRRGVVVRLERGLYGLPDPEADALPSADPLLPPSAPASSPR